MLNSTGMNTSEIPNSVLVKWEIGIQSAILFLALFGNGIVLMVLFIRKKKLSRMNTMIAHLSVADLFVAFFNVLPQLIWDITFLFYGGDFLCRSVKLFQLVAMYASSYVLVTCAIDRFLCLCYPLKTHIWTMRRMHWFVAVAWLLSLLFAIPQTVIFSYKKVPKTVDVWNCWAHFHKDETIDTMPLYITWITVSIYIIPLMLLVALYGRICFVVWTSMKTRESGNNESANKENGLLLRPEASTTTTSGNGGLGGGANDVTPSKTAVAAPRAHTQRVSKAKAKTVKLTLAVVLCYLICWGPFFVAQMWAAWDPAAPFQGATFTIITLLASLNSCANPWIFLCFADVCAIIRKRRQQRGVTSTWASTAYTGRGGATEYSRVDSRGVSIAMQEINTK